MKKLFIIICTLGFCFAGFQSRSQVSQGTHAVGLNIDWETRDIVGEGNNFVDNF